MHKLKGFIITTIVLTLLFFLITVGIIYKKILYYSYNSTAVKSDVIIVLGCQIWGRSPSTSLEYRLQKALELYEEGFAPSIIVSGGQGENEVTSESEVMKAWLIDRGIDSDVIFEEDKSTSTYENLKFSKAIMDAKGMSSAIIVSNDFHIYRSVMIAKKLNIDASGAPAPSVDYLLPYYRMREILSVIKSLLFI